VVAEAPLVASEDIGAAELPTLPEEPSLGEKISGFFKKLFGRDETP
jgi:hypothetical protein